MTELDPLYVIRHYGKPIVEPLKKGGPVGGRPEPQRIEGDVFGYRSWNASDTGLYSLNINTRSPWKPGKQTAQCHATGMERSLFHNEGLPTPQYRCTCGYFGYYEEKRHRNNSLYWDHRYNSLYWDNLALSGDYMSGIIRASGRVIMHDYGFRAQHVEILALSPTPHNLLWACTHDLLHRLGKQYEVPTFSTFEEMYREFPPTNRNGEWKNG